MPRKFLCCLALLIAPAAACSGPGEDRIEQTSIASYDPETGKLTRLTADLDKDGTIDAYTYMDGTRILRSEIDADQDGRIEKWEFHGDDGKVVRVAVSRAKNGKADMWLYPAPDGSPARVEISSAQDEAKIDRREWYEDGRVVRAEEDTDRDGRIDKWETFRGGALVSVAMDETGNGVADRRLTYGQTGELLAIESDPDARGGFNKRIVVQR